MNLLRDVPVRMREDIQAHCKKHSMSIKDFALRCGLNDGLVAGIWAGGITHFSRIEEARIKGVLYGGKDFTYMIKAGDMMKETEAEK